MRPAQRLVAAFISVLGIAACTAKLSDEDRAALNSANQNSQTAAQQSAQAIQAAQAAQQEASAARADAKAASDRADSGFQRSLRK